MTLFVLVRHGQTAWNSPERFRGRAAVELNAVGLAQAAAAGTSIAGRWRPAAVYASPMQRALQTAEAIAGPLGLAVQPHPGLADMDFGRWEGLTPEEARQRWPVMLEAWYRAPDKARPPEGETLAELRVRTVAMLAELTARHPDQAIVLVGHTVVNRVILLVVLGLGDERFWRLSQEPAAINVFQTVGQDFDVLALNDTCHLRHHG